MKIRQNVEYHDDMSEARRRFLVSCGKFAVATPPAITLLLASSNRSYAQFGSGTGPGGEGSLRP